MGLPICVCKNCTISEVPFIPGFGKWWCLDCDKPYLPFRPLEQKKKQ